MNCGRGADREDLFNDLKPKFEIKPGSHNNQVDSVLIEHLVYLIQGRAAEKGHILNIQALLYLVQNEERSAKKQDILLIDPLLILVAKHSN